MLAAERGGARNTLAAYARDLADLSAFLADAGRSIADASTDDLRDYLGALAKRGFAAASVARRLSAIRQLYRFLYAEGRRDRRSRRHHRGPQARPHAAEGADHRGCRSPARRGTKCDEPRGKSARAAARRAARLPDRDALRHRAARLRTGRAAVVGGGTQCPHAGGARQRRQGAHGPAQRSGQDRDARLSGAARRGRPRAASRNGCFPPSAKAAT